MESEIFSIERKQQYLSLVKNAFKLQDVTINNFKDKYEGYFVFREHELQKDVNGKILNGNQLLTCLDHIMSLPN